MGSEHGRPVVPPSSAPTHPEITVEELYFGPGLKELVKREGLDLSAKLFNVANDEVPDIVPTSDSSQPTEKVSHEANVNLNVHRNGVLKTFDWRNNRLLDPDNCRMEGSRKDFEFRIE